MSQSTAASTKSVSGASIEDSLRQNLNPAHLKVIDTSGGCGQSFEVLIVSSAFEGKSLLQRHRLVNDLLKDQISQVHAFSQKCLTPEQYKASNQES